MKKTEKLRKSLKSLAAFVTAAAIFCSVVPQNIFAEEADTDYIGNEAYVRTSLNDYLEYSLPRHLYTHSFDVIGMLSYSKPITLYNFDDNSVIGSEIFVFDDRGLIGKAEIYNTEDGYVSYFDTYITDDLFTAYQSGEEIAMGYVNGNLFMYNASVGYVYIDGFKKYDLPQETPEELTAITIWGETPADFALSYGVATANLNVKHIHNSTTYFADGECWAACIAMKLNYQLGYNLDTDTVFEKAYDLGLVTWDFSDSSIVNIPVEDEPEVYRHYGCNVSATSSRMTHSEIFNILRSNKPIAMSMNNNGSEIGHEVIIKGITMEASGSTYLVDDPNHTSQKSLELKGNPSQSYPSFWYDDKYGNTYENWYYTIY